MRSIPDNGATAYKQNMDPISLLLSVGSFVLVVVSLNRRLRVGVLPDGEFDPGTGSHRLIAISVISAPGAVQFRINTASHVEQARIIEQYGGTIREDSARPEACVPVETSSSMNNLLLKSVAAGDSHRLP